MSGNETICSTVFRLFSDAYVLEDDLHLAAQPPQLARGDAEEVGRVEVDAARGRLVEPEQQARERGLARAGLAHEPDRLAAVEHERDVVDRLDDAPRTRPAEAEVPTEVVDDDESSPSRADSVREAVASVALTAAPRTGVALRHLVPDDDRRRRLHGADLLRAQAGGRGSPTAADGEGAAVRRSRRSAVRRHGRARRSIRAAPPSRGERAFPSTASALPLSTIRPAYMTWMSSQKDEARPRSCVIRIIPIRRSSTIRPSSSMIRACVVTSSAVVGSSATRTSGFVQIAIAIITRWRIPPENWCG